jgi:uncharacterized protein
MPENAKSPPEPSMEEIIASISRIISEDKAQSEPVRPSADEKDDLLELTEALNEDGSVRHLAGPEGKADPESPSAAGDKPSHDIASAPLESGQSHRDEGMEPRLGFARERIVSAATSGAAAAAFAQLGALPREKRRESELGLGGGDRTLEDIVRDLLRPFLETWLNEHLPGIVERLVREEIARVVGEAGLR